MLSICASDWKKLQNLPPLYNGSVNCCDFYETYCTHQVHLLEDFHKKVDHYSIQLLHFSIFRRKLQEMQLREKLQQLKKQI